MIASLVQQYQSAATALNEPNDGTAAWLARVNEAADRMIVISREIASAGPEAVAEFARLISSNDRELALRAAHHLLDFMEPRQDVRDAALALIEGSGDRTWLENWSAEQQDE